MILKDYLEAEEFLNESLFDSIIEQPLNEAFKSDIVRKLAKSSIFRYFPSASSYNIPSKFTDGSEKITKDEKLWRKDIGKVRKGDDLYSKLSKIKLDQLEDSDFTLISKADARRKKYADGIIFWMDDKDEVAAISSENYVSLSSGRSTVFTGNILGADDDFDPEGKEPYYMVYGGKYKNDKGEEIKYEKDTRREVSRNRTTTLNLQKDPFIEYCYFLPFSVTDKKKSTRIPYEKEDSNDTVRRKNRERYEEEKVNNRRSKAKKILPEYDEKFKSLLVNPLKGKLKTFFNTIDQSKGGIKPYSGIQVLPDFMKKIEKFFDQFDRLTSAIEYNYFYNRSNASKTYENRINDYKVEMEEFLSTL